MSSEINIEPEENTGTDAFVMPEKVNDVIRRAMSQKARPPLFDAFWRSGEVAMLFGEAGAGKSVLATQIAEALARGKPIDGFVMPKRPHKVLYVDLNLSETQFHLRYTPAGDKGGKRSPYKFSERIYRGHPQFDEDLVAWVTRAVRLGGFEAVVIDDLSAVMRTDNGTFDSLRIMREMKRLSQRTGVSILVLADSMPCRRGRETSEADLRRCRVLCSVADSVFAIGADGDGVLKLRQFRSQVGKLVWGGKNAVVCRIRRQGSGLLCVEFDSRFRTELSLQKCLEIQSAATHKANGHTYDQIAEMMGIPRSRAYRLVQQWTPAIADEALFFEKIKAEVRKVGESAEEDHEVEEVEEVEEETYEEDEDDDDDVRTGSDSDWATDDTEDDEDDDVRTGSDSDWATDGTEEDEEYEDEDDEIDEEALTETERLERERRAKLPWYQRIDPHEHPFASGIRPLSIYDFESEFDEYGNELFVESRSKQTGKRKVWYTITNPTHRTRRHVDNGWNTQNDIVSNDHWLPRRE